MVCASSFIVTKVRCGHCKTLKPEYEKAAEYFSTTCVKVAAIDCNEQSNAAICSEHEIKGFPTIKLLHPIGKNRTRSESKVVISRTYLTNQLTKAHELRRNWWNM